MWPDLSKSLAERVLKKYTYGLNAIIRLNERINRIIMRVIVRIYPTSWYDHIVHHDIVVWVGTKHRVGHRYTMASRTFTSPMYNTITSPMYYTNTSVRYYFMKQSSYCGKRSFNKMRIYPRIVAEFPTISAINQETDCSFPIYPSI